jgi:hypothetical protein
MANISRVSGNRTVLPQGDTTVQPLSGSVQLVATLTNVTEVLTVQGQLIVGPYITLDNQPDNPLTNPIVSRDGLANVGNPFDIPLYGNGFPMYGTPEQRNIASVYLPGGMGIEKDLNVGGTIYGRISPEYNEVTATGTNATSTFYLTFVNALDGHHGVQLYGDWNSTNGSPGIGGLTYNPGINLLSVDNVAIASTATSLLTSSQNALHVAGGISTDNALFANTTSYVANAEILTTTTLQLHCVTSIATTSSGLHISTSTGSVIIDNTGVVELTAGNVGVAVTKPNPTGPGTVNATTGSLTIWNMGVLSLVSGDGYLGITTPGQYGPTSGSTGSLTITNLGVRTISAGTDTSVNFSTGSVTVWNISTLDSVTSRGSSTQHAISITNITGSTSSTTGALTVTGGVGVGGSLNIGRTSYAVGAEIVTTATLGNYGVTSITANSGIGINTSTGAVTITNVGVTTLTAGTDTAITTSTGSVIIWATSTLQSVTDRGASTDNAISITNSTQSNDAQSGALIVTGGVGIGGALYANITSFVDGAEILTTATLINHGVISLTAGTGIGVNTTTGEVIVNNTGVTSLTAGTDTVVTSSTGSVLIYNNSTLDSVTGRGSSTQHTILLTGRKSSTSTTTGDLVVSGGVGVSGALNIGQTSYAVGAEIVTTATLGNYGVTSITASTGINVTTSTGAVTIINTGVTSAVQGNGIGIDKTTGSVTFSNIGVTALTAGADISVNASTGSVTISDTSTLYSVTKRGATTDQIISITNNSQSLNTQSGALVVTGGVGVGGALYANTTSFVNGYEIITTATVTKWAVPATTSTLGSVIVGSGLTVDGTGLLEVDLRNLSLVIIDYSSPIVNQDGQLWWDSIGGNLYVSYQGVWVEASALSSGSSSSGPSGPSGPTGPVGPSGPSGTFTGTISGPVFISDTTSATSTTTGALVVAGGVGIGGDLYVNGTVYSANERLADTIFASNHTITDGTTATVTLDSYSLTQFRSAKYFIQVDSGTGPTAEFEVMEILLTVNNNQQVFATEYGVVYTNEELGTITADCENNIVSLLFTPNQSVVMEISLVRNALIV